MILTRNMFIYFSCYFDIEQGHSHHFKVWKGVWKIIYFGLRTVRHTPTEKCGEYPPPGGYEISDFSQGKGQQSTKPKLPVWERMWLSINDTPESLVTSATYKWARFTISSPTEYKLKLLRSGIGKCDLWKIGLNDQTSLRSQYHIDKETLLTWIPLYTNLQRSKCRASDMNEVELPKY